jgi:hypothetical protein
VALDENIFQQLLAAAYVVQEHTATLHAPARPAQPAEKLAQVAVIHTALRSGALNVSASAKVVADGLLPLTGASGVSVSLISNGFLDCVAESGLPARIPGSSIASHSLVATERLKAGNIFETADALTDIRLDIELCKALNVKSLLAAPVMCSGQLAGLIEIRWDRECAFQEADFAMFRVMAGLVAEILEPKPVRTQSAPLSEKAQAAAATIADVPLSSVSEASATSVLAEAAADVVAASPDPTPSVTPPAASATPVASCRVCGRPFGADEAFCGFCGMPGFAITPAKELQSKWASLWYIQQAQGALEHRASPEAAPTALAASVEATDSADLPASETVVGPPETEQLTPQAERGETFTYFKPIVEDYESANSDDIFGERPFWSRFEGLRGKLRLKDFVLAVVATMLAFGVFSAWPSSNGGLTWFQSTMMRFGIYHSAARSAVYGNPDLNVWVDAQNSLYYCPGSEQYGNTTEGHFTTQREALQAHSQPASGLACQ